MLFPAPHSHKIPLSAYVEPKFVPYFPLIHPSLSSLQIPWMDLFVPQKWLSCGTMACSKTLAYEEGDWLGGLGHISSLPGKLHQKGQYHSLCWCFHICRTIWKGRRQPQQCEKIATLVIVWWHSEEPGSLNTCLNCCLPSPKCHPTKQFCASTPVWVDFCYLWSKAS